MTKKIIGSIGILVGLGLATFLLYIFLFPGEGPRTSTPDPAAQRHAAVQSPPESSPEPATSQPEPAVPPQPPTSPPAAPGPPLKESGARPYVGTVPRPKASAPEQIMAPQAPLEPTEEHGLLAGRYRSFGSAKKRLEKIKEKDIPAFVRQKGKYYEVWAGPFATPEEVEQARKSLQAMKISAKKGKLTIPVPK